MFLGRGGRIFVLTTKNFTCKSLQRIRQVIWQYIKLYSLARQDEVDRITNDISVYSATILILLFSRVKNKLLYFILGFLVCVYIDPHFKKN